MGVCFFAILVLAPGPVGAIEAVGSNVAAIFVTCAISLLAVNGRLVRDGPKRAAAEPEWGRVGLMLGLGTVALYLNQQLDVLLLGYFADDATLGIYTAIAQIVTVLAFANIAAVATIQPMLARRAATDSPIDLQSVVKGGARFAFLINLAGGLPLLVLAGPILQLFGDDFARGAGALRILTVAYMTVSAISMSGAALSMRGYERQSTLVLVAGCGLTFIMNILLIPWAGLEGAALATGVSTVAWNIGLFLVARQKLGVLALPFGWRASRSMPPALRPIRRSSCSCRAWPAGVPSGSCSTWREALPRSVIQPHSFWCIMRARTRVWFRRRSRRCSWDAKDLASGDRARILSAQSQAGPNLFRNG